MKYLSIPLLLLMWGCSTPAEVINREIDRIIQVDTVTVYLPAEPNFTPVVLDNYGFGENDKVQVRVDTIDKVKKIYVKGKADTVKVAVRDTVTVVKERIVKEDNFFDLTLKETLLILLGIVAIGFLTSVMRR